MNFRLDWGVDNKNQAWYIPVLYCIVKSSNKNCFCFTFHIGFSDKPIKNIDDTNQTKKCIANEVKIERIEEK